MRGTIKIDNNKIRWGSSALLAVLILLGTYRNVFAVAALALCGLMVFFCDREFILLQIFFIMPMANIFKMAPGSQSFFTILLLAYVALHLVLPRNATAVIAGFAFFVIIMELVSGQFNLFRTIKLICNVLFLSSILNSKVKIRYKEIFLSYIVGNIVASFWGMMDSPVFKITSYVGELEVGGQEFEDVKRFTGLYSDPNYYAVGLIISLCLIVVLLHRNELNKFTALMFTVPIVYFLIQTYSKSSMIMLIVVVIFLSYSLLLKKKIIPVIILFISTILVVVLAFSGRIPALEIVVARFMASDTAQGTDVNALTTGRFDLWMMYVDYIVNNLQVLLFGEGISYGYLNGHGAHNTYCDIFYFLGIVGGGLLIASLMAISKQSRYVKVKRNLLNYSVLLCIVIMYFFLSELFYFDPPFHIFLAIAVLNQSNDEKTKKMKIVT